MSLSKGVLLSLALAAISCGDDASKETRDGAVDDGGTTKLRGDVDGHVFRADTLTPVEGATITGPNGVTARSDAQGNFKLSMLASERTALVANADTFAQAIEPVTVLAGKTAGVEFRLVGVTATVELDSSKGGQVRSATGAEVVIDEGAFVDAEGKPVSGMVTVELSVLDPSTPAGMQAFPGDFAATSRGGSEGQLESFVPMEITARSGDKVLDFAADKPAEVSFPVPGALKDKAPQTIALWSLNETTGAWVEEGIATLVTDGAGQLVYRGKLTHMSWWNCDRFIDKVTCIRGCVTRDGSPARSVTTQAEGIDYSNVGQSMTDGDGCFVEDVKAGAQLRVRAMTSDATSEWKVITAPETLMNSKTDRSKCQDVGTLELVARKAEDMGCPPGTTKCGDRCVDLSTDYDNCGSCKKSCFGGLTGASCIAGACACKGSETQCNSFDGAPRCTDLNFDEANCGKCGQRCTTGQSCEAGKCKQLACADGLTLCGSTCVDTSNNGRNCGACDAVCPMGQSCEAGTCKALTCPENLEFCGNMCVARGTCRGMIDCTKQWSCGGATQDAQTFVSVCKLCDGQMDCANGKDEMGPSNGPCTTCPSGALARACDGVKDCPGGEDELKCDSVLGGNPTPTGGTGGAGSGGQGGGGGNTPDTGTGGKGGAGSGGAGTGSQTGGSGGAAGGGGQTSSPDAGLGGTGGAGSGSQ
ncbi:MAG TPA: hypothetical protein VJV78_06850, partial [Polyangiales bacterium]|nr:hypothetical protein [Polyangiales bacterium]